MGVGLREGVSKLFLTKIPNLNNFFSVFGAVGSELFVLSKNLNVCVCV